jgi:excinuclease UvrABC ATPase subunit
VLAKEVRRGDLVILYNLPAHKTAGAGGEVVATGTPEEIAACRASHTGRFLKALLRA